MRVIDYLCFKYEVTKPTTMLGVEQKVFGIPKLTTGWLEKYGHIEITPNMAKRLKFELNRVIEKRTKRSVLDGARRGLEALDKAWLEIKRKPNAEDAAFLQSKAWKRLRLQALKLHGSKCQACGATPANGAVLNVDHIKPRLLFPSLALSIDNLQVLCSDCNEGKGNWDMTDFRFSRPERVE